MSALFEQEKQEISLGVNLAIGNLEPFVSAETLY